MAAVLVVDDDPGVRKVLADAFTEDGLEVRTAANGVEALRCIGVAAPDVVLLDLEMPAMDGATLLRTMRTAQLTTPVVLMSGNERAAAAVADEADGVLVKPFDLDRVLTVVEKFAPTSA